VEPSDYCEANVISDTHSADARRPPTRGQVIGRSVLVVLILLVVIAGVAGYNFYNGYFVMRPKMMAMAAMPQTISALPAREEAWQDAVQSTGTLRAVRGADLSAQAAGVVQDIDFDSGNDVPAGKVLLRLKPNDDYAKLEQLEAAAELAQQTLKRDQEQFAAQAISQATLDTDTSTLKSARAQVLAQQALIEEKIVKAPFAGRLGIRLVDIGQYLSAGTSVVTLQALDPILIDFYVPQQALAQLKVGQALTASVDTYAGQTFSGTVESINAKVDAASRNVQVRAALRNADKRLVPGMFATVHIAAGATRQLITLPQTAITYNPYGDAVFVVQPGKSPDGKPISTAQQRFVRVGATRGDQVAIESGLKPGEVVVTAGQIKLRNGAAVAINNDVLPGNEAQPTPPNE
jgi:membrane fusion protein (multidrug efflux system)